MQIVFVTCRCGPRLLCAEQSYRHLLQRDHCTGSVLPVWLAAVESAVGVL